MAQAQVCLSAVLAQLLGYGERNIGQVSPLCCCSTPTHSACNYRILFWRINGIITVFIRERRKVATACCNLDTITLLYWRLCKTTVSLFDVILTAHRR